MDTFDPKPEAPPEVRGPFRPIATKVTGMHLTEIFPRTAQITDPAAPKYLRHIPGQEGKYISLAKGFIGRFMAIDPVLAVVYQPDLFLIRATDITWMVFPT